MSSEDLSSSSSIITPTAMQQRSHRLSRQSHVHHQGLFTFFSYLFTLIVYFCFILSRHVIFSPIFHSANSSDCQQSKPFFWMENRKSWNMCDHSGNSLWSDSISMISRLFKVLSVSNQLFVFICLHLLSLFTFICSWDPQLYGR